MSRNPLDLTSERSLRRIANLGSRWTPIRMSDIRKGGAVCWDCRCSCGNKSPKDDPLTAYDILNGRTKSCGCLRDEGGKEFEKKKRNLKVYKMVRKGKPRAEVAERFDISEARVYQIYNKVKHDRKQARQLSSK